MTLGLVGRKCGMTRVFTDEGVSIPVSVIEIEPNRVTQVKTSEGSDGYSAVQLTTGSRKAKHLNKPESAHFAKAKVDAGRGLWEFRVTDDHTLTVGAEIKVDIFNQGQFIDVTGTTKGKGFSGVIKRYHFATQDATHGNSLSHRAPGSIGQRQSPGRVFKGKKMAGQLGSQQRTVQNLEIVKVDLDKNLLLVKGAIPGAPGGNVIVKPAVKKHNSKKE
jgi:large subunit ribosomal protein L3